MSIIYEKYLGPSKKYKYVYGRIACDRVWWVGKVFISKTQSTRSKNFDTEREAAIYVDKQLIECGKPPVNILKRK